MKIAVFLSGRGSGFESLHDAIESGSVLAKIEFVASNHNKAYGLKTAEELGIERYVFNRKEFDFGKDFSDYMLKTLRNHEIDLIVLAGYLRKIPPRIVREYSKKIINIHPALLPKYGGKGMYGLNVHKAVLAAGEIESGVTVHYVDEIYDNGEIIDQIKVPVLKDDTAETLAARILKTEHSFYPKVLAKLIEEFNLNGRYMR